MAQIFWEVLSRGLRETTIDSCTLVGKLDEFDSGEEKRRRRKEEW